MTRPEKAKIKLYEDLLRCLKGSAGSPWNRRLQRQRFPSPANLRKTPPSPDQHLPADEEEGDLDALVIAAPSAAKLRPRPEARSIGRNGDQDDLRRRWLDGSSPGHLQDEALTTASQKPIGLATWEELAQNRQIWRIIMKTGVVIDEVNRIASAKATTQALNHLQQVHATKKRSAHESASSDIPSATTGQLHLLSS
ncbi:hypothetical protein SprV_0100153800 [Sparganum proliferum]